MSSRPSGSRLPECPLCPGRLVPRKVSYSYLGVDFGKYGAEVCNSCGESFFTERACDEMETKAKALGLWGIGSNTKVSIAGNSLMIRIPKVLARAVGLAKGTAVKLRPAGKGRMLVESDV